MGMAPVAADYVEQVAAGIVKQLREGTAPWVKPWQPGERFMPYNPTSGNEYRGMNAVWLMSQAGAKGYGDPRWMTYKQAAAEDAQVRKGEKGTAIQYWKWEGEEPVRDARGKPVLDEHGEPRKQRVRYERPRVWTAVVFNAEQIDGLPDAPARPGLPEWERHERAERILAASGVELRHQRGDRAFYRPSEDRIVLPERGQFASADRFYATALHELGHATGHPSRLDRDLAHPFGSEGYAREELRAEIASMMLGDQLGIGHDPSQHVAYVASWIKALEDDPREVFRAAADAEKITRMVRSFELTQEHRTAREQGQSPELEQEAGTPAIRARTPTAVRESHPAMSDSNEERTYLAVPYEEKDGAKQAGAKWDRTKKAWFVPAGMALDAFERWMPRQGAVQVEPGPDPREQFAQALRDAGLLLREAPVMDGQLHRVPVKGDRGEDRSGAYKGHLDGHPAGFIQNFKTGDKVNWKASGRQVAALSSQDRAELAAEAARKLHERTQERERLYERTAEQVGAMWNAATPAGAHPYLDAKGIGAHGLRQDRRGNLLVPVQDVHGKLWSLQRISPDGSKQFKADGRVDGGHYVIGDPARPGPLLIAEGFATAATVHELTGHTAVVAFNAGNLAKVAEAYRERFPDRAIYVAGDTDHEREAEGKPNVGRIKAEEAAAAISGRAMFPVFPDGVRGSDWNDLAQSLGRDNARSGLQAAIRVADRLQAASEIAAARFIEPEAARTPDRTPTKQREREGADLER